MTRRQKEVLDFIRAYFDGQGVYPTLVEIKAHLGLSSVSTAHYHVKALEEQGYLQREPNRHRSMEPLDCEMVKVAVLGRIAAGRPIEAIEDATDSVAIPKSMLPAGGDFYALKVQGESMIDENIRDGDLVVVKRQETALDGEKVVALVDRYEATLKKLYREAGRIRLQPANPNVAAILIESERVAIQGKVVCVVKAPAVPSAT